MKVEKLSKENDVRIISKNFVKMDMVKTRISESHWKTPIFL